MMRYRPIHFYFFIISVLVLASAFALQEWAHLQPCVLCWMQRYCWMLIGLVSVIAALHNPRGFGRWIYTGFIFIFSLVGLLATGRQIWLQHQPQGELISCLPSPIYLVRHLPFAQAFSVIVKGSADCAKVAWTFLGVGLAQWSFIAFAVFAVLVLVICLFSKQK